MKTVIFFSFVFAFIFFSCKNSIVSPNEFTSGVYNYVAYDTLGIIFTTGSMTLSRNDSTISGNWSFNINNGDSGGLIGKTDKDSIELKLYGWSDLNFNMKGKFLYNTITGKWILSGWGIMRKGTFKGGLK
jgi:hypothetical protein